MTPKGGFSVLKEAVKEFGRDQAMIFAASLAFYTALSLAPLLLVLLAVVGLMGPEAQEYLVNQIRNVVGPQAAGAINTVIGNLSSDRGAGRLSVIIGGVTATLAATGLFIQLQTALNHIWDVKVKPGQAFIGWLRKRFVSLLMVAGIILIAFAALFVSAAIEMVFGEDNMLWQWVNIGVSLLVFILLFAMIFKYLPDVKISWHDVLIGAFCTAILFVIGKWGIGHYLGRSSVGSAYGAAGSVVVLLVWVYYAAVIIFFGAELTQVYARRFGKKIQPDKHAMCEDQPV